MKQAAAHTTTNEGNRTRHSSEPSKNSDPRQTFIMAALNMSWQLAIVVLVPILLGFKLDKHLDSLPLWTGIGFIVAMAGMAVVVWRQLKMFSPKITQADIDKAKRLRDQEEDDQ